MRAIPALPLSFVFLAAAAPLPAADPVPPDAFHCIDPELEITVWAASPMLFNPTNMDIDRHGRVWVAEGVDYRGNLNRRPEGDRIVVLEDTDGDGKADRSWPFVQEKFLRAPMGVAVVGNKVVVSMTPDLIVYTDHDGDAVFDESKGDTREVLLTGFIGRAHDHSLHSVTVGPDGKWYFSAGNCGSYFTDNSGRTFRIGSRQTTSWWPKDPAVPDRDPSEFAGQPSDDGNVWVGGFIGRMNPDGTGAEVLAHNLRNSYENCVTSFGDIFANDNDDQPACRTFWVVEGGNYGFASADGQRSWQADQRPGQSVQTATWRQEDPGVAPAGDIYGAGSPTGIVFYENGALGTRWEGTLLSCEPALNTILGYRPEPDGDGWKLERFSFLTTNREGNYVGTDSTGGDGSARPDDARTLFRPSDIAVGPDGAVYIADWLDPRVGGHGTLDDSMSGTIYRVAPKDFRPKVPAVDVSTAEGALAALKSPAVHVRALGAAALRAQGKGIPPEAAAAALQGTVGAARAFLEARILNACGDPGSPERAALANSLRAGAAGIERSLVVRQSGKNLPAPDDPAFVARLRTDPLTWPEEFAATAWQLHPPASVPAFAARAMAQDLPERARLDALTAIGFNTTAEAAGAMLDAAQKTTGLVRDTALWWLLHLKDSAWRPHRLNAALRERGIYDADNVQLVPVSVAPPPAAGFSAAEAAAIDGDPARGADLARRCMVCHRIGNEGAEFGPDMTAWGRTQPLEVVVRSIVDPGAEIAHGFHGTELVTNDGIVIHGIVSSDGDPVVIRSMGGITQLVPASRIREKRPLHRSLMMTPAQLDLTARDVADIAAFLRK